MFNKKIQTKVLSGFLELTPNDQIAFDDMKDTISTVFEQFGFVSLDTPVIERTEVLLAKAGGETEKQIYTPIKGDSELALRFDLTVPLARYVAEHFGDLTFPFRRYQIDKVYRGERPQKGRYREFYQADIDIIGDGKLSLKNDAEVISVIYTIFKKLDFGPFTVRINNRKLINGLMSELGIGDKSVEVMRTIDKMEKIGKEAVKDILVDLGISDVAIQKIFNFLEISGTSEEILSSLKKLDISDDMFTTGISELEELIGYLKSMSVPSEYYIIDLSIARGLDYYTGTVYETTLSKYPEIGSVCSGGRYDNLAEVYTKRQLPGVGMSIGFTRLFSQLKEAGLINNASQSRTRVLIVPLTEDVSKSFEVASDLRESNIPTEVYLEDTKLEKKLKYANKKGIEYVILIGEEELQKGVVTFRNMESGEQKEVSFGDVVEEVM